MITSKEMAELHRKRYDKFLSYIERKIINEISNGFIFINEDEALDNDVKFRNSGWITLLEEAGYKTEYCTNFTQPTYKIYGW